jgi:hypothetical protein
VLGAKLDFTRHPGLFPLVHTGTLITSDGKMIPVCAETLSLTEIVDVTKAGCDYLNMNLGFLFNSNYEFFTSVRTGRSASKIGNDMSE